MLCGNYYIPLFRLGIEILKIGLSDMAIFNCKHEVKVPNMKVKVPSMKVKFKAHSMKVKVPNMKEENQVRARACKLSIFLYLSDSFT